MIREAFLETDYNEGIARQKRDKRVAELQTHGYACRSQTLHRVPDGRPVYIVEAQKPEPPKPSNRRPITRASRRRDSSPTKQMREAGM